MELNTVCYATLQFDEPWTLESYLKVGGYEALKKIVLSSKVPRSVSVEPSTTLRRSVVV